MNLNKTNKKRERKIKMKVLTKKECTFKIANILEVLTNKTSDEINILLNKQNNTIEKYENIFLNNIEGFLHEEMYEFSHFNYFKNYFNWTRMISKDMPYGYCKELDTTLENYGFIDTILGNIASKLFEKIITAIFKVFWIDFDKNEDIIIYDNKEINKKNILMILIEQIDIFLLVNNIKITNNDIRRLMKYNDSEKSFKELRSHLFYKEINIKKMNSKITIGGFIKLGYINNSFNTILSLIKNFLPSSKDIPKWFYLYVYEKTSQISTRYYELSEKDKPSDIFFDIFYPGDLKNKISEYKEDGLKILINFLSSENIDQDIYNSIIKFNTIESFRMLPILLTHDITDGNEIIHLFNHTDAQLIYDIISVAISYLEASDRYILFSKIRENIRIQTKGNIISKKEMSNKFNSNVISKYMVNSMTSFLPHELWNELDKSSLECKNNQDMIDGALHIEVINFYNNILKKDFIEFTKRIYGESLENLWTDLVSEKYSAFYKKLVILLMRNKELYLNCSKKNKDIISYSLLKQIESNKIKFDLDQKLFFQGSKTDYNLRVEDIIKSSINEELSSKNNSILLSFISNLKPNHKKLMPNYCLCTVDIMSTSEMLKFNDDEYYGDLIYRVIINHLKLKNFIICNSKIDYYSGLFQKELFSSLNLSSLIQTYGLNIANRDISIEDNIEVIVWNLYDIYGYEITFNFIKKLFIDNCKDYLVAKETLEFASSEYSYINNKFNNKPILKNILVNNSLSFTSSIYRFQNSSKDQNFEKIITEITSDILNTLFIISKKQSGNFHKTSYIINDIDPIVLWHIDKSMLSSLVEMLLSEFDIPKLIELSKEYFHEK